MRPQAEDRPDADANGVGEGRSCGEGASQHEDANGQGHDAHERLNHERYQDHGREVFKMRRPQHEEEGETEGIGGLYGRLPSLDRSEVSCASVHDDDDDDRATVPLHALYGSEPLPPPIIIDTRPRTGGKLSRIETRLSRIDEAASRQSRIDEASSDEEVPPRRRAIRRLAGVLMAAAALAGGCTIHNRWNHSHSSLEPPTLPPATALANSTALLLRQIDLENQLADLERSTTHEESNSLRRVGLLSELLKSHRQMAKEDVDEEALAEVERKLRGAAKFEVGGTVEQVYNANTLRNRVLYPFRVEDVHFVSEELMGEAGEGSHVPRRLNHEHHEDGGEGDGPEDSGHDRSDEDGAHAALSAPSSGIRYTIVRLLDGFVVRDVPESFLRWYEPYPSNSRALCNMGDADVGEIIMSPCHIVEYVPPDDAPTADEHEHVRAKREGEATEAAYEVRLRRPEGEEVAVKLPIGRLHRHS